MSIRESRVLSTFINTEFGFLENEMEDDTDKKQIDMVVRNPEELHVEKNKRLISQISDNDSLLTDQSNVALSDKDALINTDDETDLFVNETRDLNISEQGEDIHRTSNFVTTKSPDIQMRLVDSGVGLGTDSYPTMSMVMVFIYGIFIWYHWYGMFVMLYLV